VKEGEIWVYVPVGHLYEPWSEIPSYASIYLVLTVTKSSIFLLDLRNGREVPYYDIQEDEYNYVWRKINSDGSP